MAETSEKPLDVLAEDDLKLDENTEGILRGLRHLITFHGDLDMCKSEFCRPDLDLTNQINELFPTEQSLTQLDGVIAQVEAEIAELDSDLVILKEFHFILLYFQSQLVESHGSVYSKGTEILNDAQKAMERLELRIECIRGKTRSSDEVEIPNSLIFLRLSRK